MWTQVCPTPKPRSFTTTQDYVYSVAGQRSQGTCPPSLSTLRSSCVTTGTLSVLQSVNQYTPALPCPGKSPNLVFLGKSLCLMCSMANRTFSSRAFFNSFSLPGMLLEWSGWLAAEHIQKMGRGATISVLGSLKMSFQGRKRRPLNVILGDHGIRMGGGGVTGATQMVFKQLSIALPSALDPSPHPFPAVKARQPIPRDESPYVIGS